MSVQIVDAARLRALVGFEDLIEPVSRKQLEQNILADWVSSASMDIAMIDEYSAIRVAPGSPYKSMENTLEAIRR